MNCCPFAQVLTSPEAKIAPAAGLVEPGNACSIAFTKPGSIGAQSLDDTHDLVSGNNRQSGQRQIPLDRVQVGVAEPARVHPDSYFISLRLRNPVFPRLQGLFLDLGRGFQNHGSHDPRSLTYLPRRREDTKVRWDFAPTKALLNDNMLV